MNSIVLFLFYFVYLLNISFITSNNLNINQNILNLILKWQNNEIIIKEQNNQNISIICLNKTFITFILIDNNSIIVNERIIKSIIHLNDCHWELIIFYSIYETKDDKNEFESYPPFHLSYLPYDKRIIYKTIYNLTLTESILSMLSLLNSKFIVFIRSETIFESNFISQIKSNSMNYNQSNCLTIQSLGNEDNYVCQTSIISNKNFTSQFLKTNLSNFFQYQIQNEKPNLLPIINNNNDNDNSSSSNDQTSVFIFPEEKNVFFRDNVLGLKHTLKLAQSIGCINSSLQVIYFVLIHNLSSYSYFLFNCIFISYIKA